MVAHDNQRAHNKNAHDFLATRAPEYVDWQITTLFYAVLHSVNRYFQLRGLPIPQNHHKRSESVMHELPDIAEEYKNLQTLSEQSRYCGIGEVDEDSVTLALKSYNKIEDYLKRSDMTEDHTRYI